MIKAARQLLAASALVAVMASLTGCDTEGPENIAEAADERTEENSATLIPPSETDAPPPPSASVGDDEDIAGGNPDGSNPLPPPGAFRFVGAWAADADMCDGQAWRFTRESMETPAGSVCKFVNASPVGGGYDISARCTSEGPPVDDNLKIRFAESAQAMLFESESIADAGLIYCGPIED